ncbi:hypothetical protein TeGR_g285, partial [Tetraparma gracilis]
KTHKLDRSVRVDRKNKSVPQTLLLTKVSPSSISLRTAPSLRRDLRPPPHAVHGVIEIQDEEHGCSTMTMALRVYCAEAVKKARTRAVIDKMKSNVRTGTAEFGDEPLTSEEALLVLDDLLSLLTSLYERFARPDEVDAAVHKKLAAEFLSSTTPTSEHEDSLLERARGYASKPWTRMAGTVSNPVE